MVIYRFRVLIDDKSEAFRDIEIRSNQTFLDFHKAIKKAFGFKGEEMACFYVSDEEWAKGNDIPLTDMGFAEDGKVPALMHETQIGDHMRSTKQRFVYAYDYLHMWMFLCELIHAGEPVKGQRYPKMVMSVGTPPGEHSRMDAALLPGNSLEEEDMREEAEEIYDANEDMGHSEDGDEEHDEFGHSEDDGMSGHEELPEDYH
jgi:hypothetical protein